MHPLILIGLVFATSLVWTCGILFALNRLARDQNRPRTPTHTPGPPPTIAGPTHSPNHRESGKTFTGTTALASSEGTETLPVIITEG